MGVVNTASKKRPGQYHHGRLADALLDAAAAVVAARGPDAVSLRELAREIGVSPNAPYRHFADLDSLLSEVAGRGFDDLAQQCLEGGALEDGLLGMGTAYISFSARNPNLYRLMYSGRLDVTRHDRLARSAGTAWSVLCAGIVRTGLRGEAAETAAVAMWSLLHGYALLQLHGLVGERRPPDGAEVKRLLGALSFGAG
ncbi:MAG: TetR/AcrR family transcriptional regulator [Fimbriimonadaceae bacterium]|nr:TetR/AcrR family transcriptional regulator [Fimbriimonadaceae bacterium]QYK55820.1 MAG: TetR/AcrR family transcriptional regulator [Fimbriimonadaceae bacterium]